MEGHRKSGLLSWDALGRFGRKPTTVYCKPSIFVKEKVEKKNEGGSTRESFRPHLGLLLLIPALEILE